MINIIEYASKLLHTSSFVNDLEGQRVRRWSKPRDEVPSMTSDPTTQTLVRPACCTLLDASSPVSLHIRWICWLPISSFASTGAAGRCAVPCGGAPCRTGIPTASPLPIGQIPGALVRLGKFEDFHFRRLPRSTRYTPLHRSQI